MMSESLVMDAPLTAADGVPLAVKLKRQARLKQLKALGLIAPLALFLLLTFLLPIGLLLKRSVDNPEVVSVLPQTSRLLADWDQRGLPSEAVFNALAADLTRAREEKTVPELAKRLNMEISGFRSLIQRTARKMPLELAPGASVRDRFIEIDERWGDPDHWHAIARNAKSWTPYYVYSALDLRETKSGTPELAPEEERAFLKIFGRTLWMSLWVTIWCIALGYPIAYWLATLPKRQSNLLMILVLLPFWTSVLVRVAAWIVLLQSEGLINRALMGLGVIDSPLPLAFNRMGVYIAMVHILLPFIILPTYSVMKSIPATYMRAAISLGDHPFAAFWKIYFPQTVAGVAAGALLVFIMCIGYYITPALLGGPEEQMVSYFVAFYTNVTINWGMAAALGSLLLVATMTLYAVYSKLVGANRLSLG
ncbi:putative spermidine/putrescine transport system permease protein [Gulbenkiania mobilis]|uniref:Spermidine/putrescine transport system permease protein n=2 Tax=Gulbenkiania mobilis TaxID=397457 RepID=A0ABY2CUV9_GULMO|nr:putative spermidine/putrescine transport system permease protein [Gulbenkiania mobilis]